MRARSSSGGLFVAFVVGLVGLANTNCGSSGGGLTAPSNLTYSSNPAVYTLGTAIAPNTPSSGGGAVASYSVSPALPAGLSLNPTTGVITGTPTAITATANYRVTATNATGNTTATLSITVNDAAPTNLAYSSNPAVYTQGTPIVPNTPSNGGGAVVSYSVSPALPAGLGLDPATGIITGTPTALSAVTSYTVTATNAGGSTTVSLSITVNDLAPANLTYSTNPATYTKGAAITPNTPSHTDGAPGSYSVSPALPAGLSLNTTTGVITGTPTAITAAADYTVTATNTGGSTTVVLNITVRDAAPANLTYSTNPAAYTKGVAITPNMPSNGGGAVVSYSVAPALPSGLTLNTSTGVISGTPTAITASATYTVTATNTGGSTTAGVVVAVTDVAPANLTYSVNPATYTRGAAIAANNPSSTGGAVVSYSVSPALPAGLTLNTSTGVITGTPTVVLAAANYTVTATNTGGSTTVSLNITVKDIPPATLTYSVNPATYTRGTAIAANNPSSTGGAVVSYSVAPALPAGLALNTSTGVIAGTPTLVLATATYVVTATNSGGSTTVNLVITVNDAAPTALTYSSNPATYTKGVAITANNPANNGGTITSYSVSPALPGGLTLNTSTGVITGTPTVVAATAVYVVTGSNSGGSTTANLSVTVNDVAPINLTYSANPASYTKGTAIAANTPTNSGGAIVSYSVSPALPGGLTLNTSTGVITGTPTVVAVTATYVVTGTNSGGTATANLSITVKDIPPTNLIYTTNPATYTKGTAIPANNPSSGGGAVVSYSVAPALPAGLALNTSTGVISGTPTAVTATATYVVTATNSGGSITANLVITVNDVPQARFAFVANFNDNTLSAYTVDSTTGRMRANGYVITGTNPRWVAVDPSGKFAYVTNIGSGNVSAYTINASTGVLTSAGAPVTAGARPYAVAVDPSSKFAYVTNFDSNDVSAFTINGTTGALSIVGTNTAAGTGPGALAVHPSGRFLYVANQTSGDVSAYSINTTNGALTSVGPATIAGTVPYSVTVDPTGKFLYVANQSSNNVSAYTINATTGALTSVGTAVAAGTTPNSLRVEPTGKFLYVANFSSNDVSGFSINATTGALTSLGTATAAGTNPSSITIDVQGKFAYVANANSNDVTVFTINGSSGALSVFQTMSARADALSIAVAQGVLPVTYVPKFAFVANSLSNNVTPYTVNAATGALTVGTAVGAGTAPGDVTVDPSGRFAYAANATSGDVSAYTINATTGALTSVGSAVAAGTNPLSVTVDPSGRFAYVANQGSNTVSGYSINTSTGALTSLGAAVAAGTGPVSVTIDPTGRFVYVANQVSNDVSGYSINPSTGALTSVGVNVAAGTGPTAVTVDPTGKLAFVSNANSGDVSAYRISGTSGALTSVGPTVGAGTTPSSAVVHPTAAFLYVTNRGSNDVSRYSFTTSGALSSLGTTTAAGTNPSSVTIDPSGGFAYVTNFGANTVSGYSVNTSSGALTSLGAATATGTNPTSVAVSGVIQ